MYTFVIKFYPDLKKLELFANNVLLEPLPFPFFPFLTSDLFS